MPNIRRVTKELACTFEIRVQFLLSRVSDLLYSTKDWKNDKSTNIHIELIENSLFHLRGSFEGPNDSPYEGGHFEVVSILADFSPASVSARL